MSARKTQPKKRTKATGKRAARATRGGRTKSAARSARPASKPKAKPTRKPAKAQAASKKAAAKKASDKQLAKQKQAEKAKLLREREQAQKAKEKAQQAKEREREKAQQAKEREREQALKAKEKAQQAKEREREQALKAKEKERLAKEREREKAQQAKEREKLKAQQAAEKARIKKEAEAQRAREKAEKEAERKRLIAEREAEKEAARRAKEEERARREAEREAYRKAKEAERERLRAEREAARRLREGKVARATRAAQKMDGLRMGSTRVYDPAAIPNQAGTTRHTGPSLPTVHRLVGVRHADSSPRNPSPAPAPLPVVEKRPTPTPMAPLPPVAEGVEERYRRILERLAVAPEALKKEYEETLEMSWIHHDSALEGVVYTFQELRAAMDPTSTATPDSSMQPVCEEIRRHRQAIAYVRDLGERKRVPLNVDVVKRLFVMLHPEEGDVKTVKYRKDIPQHRLYFHEYAAPDKIAYRVRQIMDWLNGPEAKKMKNPLRVGARVHYDLLRVFPFAQDSGKVSRLLMNIVLLRGGYPPAIVHSTERQRYYEALKGQLPVIIQLVNESIMNALASIEKRLDDEGRTTPSSGAVAPASGASSSGSPSSGSPSSSSVSSSEDLDSPLSDDSDLSSSPDSSDSPDESEDSPSSPSSSDASAS